MMHDAEVLFILIFYGGKEGRAYSRVTSAVRLQYQILAARRNVRLYRTGPDLSSLGPSRITIFDKQSIRNYKNVANHWMQFICLHSRNITKSRMVKEARLSQKTTRHLSFSSSCGRRFGVPQEGMPRARVGVDSWEASWQFPQITP